MRVEDVPDLQQFLASYLHQDFDIEFATWEEAVAGFVAESTHGRVRRALEQLELLLKSDIDKAELGQLLRRLNCYYDPTPDGQSTCEWLLNVQLELKRLLAMKPEL